MTTYRSRAAEQRTADDFGVQQDLMCSAHGCPNRWSVDAGNGRLCSAHAWSEPHIWPQVTQSQLDVLADRARRSQYVQPPARHVPNGEKLAILRDLRDAVASQPKRRTDWARRIVQRSESGDRVPFLVLRMAQIVVAKSARKEQA
jgi:hypothetical protein